MLLLLRLLWLLVQIVENILINVVVVRDISVSMLWDGSWLLEPSKILSKTLLWDSSKATLLWDSSKAALLWDSSKAALWHAAHAPKLVVKHLLLDRVIHHGHSLAHHLWISEHFPELWILVDHLGELWIHIDHLLHHLWVVEHLFHCSSHHGVVHHSPYSPSLRLVLVGVEVGDVVRLSEGSHAAGVHAGVGDGVGLLLLGLLWLLLLLGRGDNAVDRVFTLDLLGFNSLFVREHLASVNEFDVRKVGFYF